MAISGLQQRLAPLEDSWLPFGALRIPPWMEQAILKAEPLSTANRSFHRRCSWGGYCPHGLIPFIVEKQIKSDGGYLCHQSKEDEDTLPEAPANHLKIPLPSKEGLGKAVGNGPWCYPDSTTATPNSLSSSPSSFSEEEDDRKDPIDAPSCERDKFQFRFAPISHVACAYHADGPALHERDVKGMPEAGVKPLKPPITTLMIKNLSRTLTRRGLMDVLNGVGYSTKYDFIHLPMTFGCGKNKGFAFVNFVSPEVAVEFASRFPHSDGTPIKDKIWHVAPADVQGLKANASVLNSRRVDRVRNKSFRPLLVVPQ